MSHSLRVIGVLSTLLALSCSLVACEKDPRQPRYEIAMLTDMQEPVPAEAFGTSAVFNDGKNLQAPPAGSISREGPDPFPYSASEEDGDRAGAELKNPLISSATELERGKVLYDRFCLVCHGVSGDGDGPLIPKYPNPPAFTAKRLLDMADGRIFWTITVGRRDMKSHATQISVDDRWRLVLFIRDLQKKK